MGTSAPSGRAMSMRRSRDRPSCQSWLRPSRTVAASELPPPRPAPMGICLSRVMRTPNGQPVASFRARAARRVRSSSAEKPSGSCVRPMWPEGSSSRVTWSSRSMNWKTVSSRCRPSARRPVTCRKRLSLAGAGRCRRVGLFMAVLRAAPSGRRRAGSRCAGGSGAR